MGGLQRQHQHTCIQGRSLVPVTIPKEKSFTGSGGENSSSTSQGPPAGLGIKSTWDRFAREQQPKIPQSIIMCAQRPNIEIWDQGRQFFCIFHEETICGQHENKTSFWELEGVRNSEQNLGWGRGEKKLFICTTFSSLKPQFLVIRMSFYVLVQGGYSVYGRSISCSQGHRGGSECPCLGCVFSNFYLNNVF